MEADQKIYHLTQVNTDLKSNIQSHEINIATLKGDATRASDATSRAEGEIER